MSSVFNLSSPIFPTIDHRHHCFPNVKPQFAFSRSSIHLSNSRITEVRAQLTDTIPVAAKSISKDEVMKAEKQVIVGTYGRAPLVLTSGKGCKLYDIEGREYLDLTSGIAVNALGHGDPDWVKAVTDQANLLAHVSNIYYSLPQVRFHIYFSV